RSPHLPSPVLPMTPLDPDAQARLQHRYSAAWTVLAAAATQDDGAAVEPLFPHAAVLHVELQHALRQEMAMTLPDLLRRVAIGSTGHPGWPLLQACAKWTTQHAGWTEERSTREAHALDAWFRARSAGP